MKTESNIRKSLFPTAAQRAGRAFHPPILDGQIVSETLRPAPQPENPAQLRADNLYYLWHVTVSAEHYRNSNRDHFDTLELEFQNPADEASARAAALKACKPGEGFTVRIVSAQPASHSRVERALRPFSFPRKA